MMPNVTARIAAAALCIAGSLACAAEAQSAQPPSFDVLIQNATLVHPASARVQPGMSVLVRGGRIAEVGPAAGKSVRGVAKLDATGKFLSPGLMDSHVHVSDASGIPIVSPDPAVAELRKSFLRQAPRSYLYFGVTQVLDLAGLPEGLQEFEAQPLHPDLHRCGAAVTLDGYPMVFIDKSLRYEVWPKYVYEPANAARHPLPPGAKAEQHTPEAIIDHFAASGARCIKIFIEDGFGPGGSWPNMSKETLQRVRAHTRKRGLTLVAHANAVDMQRAALDVGVDVLSHGVWNWNEHTSATGLPDVIAAQAREIHARRIGVQPTLRVLAGTADIFRHDTLKDPNYRHVVPGPVLEWYGTEAAQFYKRELRAGYDGADDTKIAHSWLVTNEQGMRVVKYLHGLGHPLLLGSDTPSAPTYGSQPGYDTYREMRLMAQAGVPLAAILQAATINNARQFGLERDYGSIEPGKVANLVLLGDNPLLTLRAWDAIDKVILRGQVLERAALSATRATPDTPRAH